MRSSKMSCAVAVLLYLTWKKHFSIWNRLDLEWKIVMWFSGQIFLMYLQWEDKHVLSGEFCQATNSVCLHAGPADWGYLLSFQPCKLWMLQCVNKLWLYMGLNYDCMGSVWCGGNECVMVLLMLCCVFLTLVFL